MSELSNILRRLRRRKKNGQRAGQSKKRHKLSVESLENRILLASDFGDLPAAYVPSAAGPASHEILPLAPSFGAVPDAELTVQNDPGALGDDTNGTNDEQRDTNSADNGVSFGPQGNSWIAGTFNGLNLNLRGPAGSVARVDAWVDFDQDLNLGEDQILDNFGVTIGPSGQTQTTIPIPVPANAASGLTFARLRVSSQGNLDVFGPASNGEVEDHSLTILSTRDFGDAPASYEAGNQASHVFTPTSVRLGANVDADPAALSSSNADGDDISNQDDENGVVFANGGDILVGAVETITVSVTNVPAGGARLHAWVDLNRNGVFDDPAESITTSVIGDFVAADSNVNLSINAATAVAGPSFLRVRVIDDAAALAQTIGPNGDAGNDGFGEIEDFPLTFVSPFDFGDAPDNPIDPIPDYPTRLSSDGARHTIVPGAPRLGSLIDGEGDGLESIDADGDDSDKQSDEDGITTFFGDFFDTANGNEFEANDAIQWIAGQSAGVEVDVQNAPGHVHIFMDTNQDGDFDLKLVDGDTALTPVGLNVFNFTIPETATPGSTYVRVRIQSAAGNLGPSGLAADGEVEDYKVQIIGVDFGDLPDNGIGSDLGQGDYRTIIQNNNLNDPTSGPSHIIRGPRLGNSIDQERDGLPGPLANGDDIDKVADEDGVRHGSGAAFGTQSFIVGGTELVEVIVSNSTGRLDGWIDFNQDGDFNDLFDGPSGPNTVSEHFINNQTVTPGLNQFSVFVPIPDGSMTGPRLGTTATRFRISTAGNLSPSGHASDGEVEDYTVDIEFQEPLDFGDAAEGGSPVGQPPADRVTRLVNNGPHHVITSSGPILGQIVDAETDGIPTFDALGDDNNNLDDDDGVVVVTPLLRGTVVTMDVTVSNADGFVNAWADGDSDGIFETQIITNAFIQNAETKALTFSLVANNIFAGSRYFRFRVSSIPDLAPTGFAPNGEVEDYLFNIQSVTAFDYGDAPDTGPGTGAGNYKTVRADGGAFHDAVDWSPKLGGSAENEMNARPQRDRDEELDAYTSADGLGDDSLGGFQAGPGSPDDENGITLSNGGVWYVGQRASITATARGTRQNSDVYSDGQVAFFDRGFFSAWADTDRNGTFDLEIADDFRFSFTTMNNNEPNPVTFGFDVPSTAVPGFSFLRGRISRAGGLLPTGGFPPNHVPAPGSGLSSKPAGTAPFGEVEDYRFEIRALDFGDAPDILAGTTKGDYNTIVRNSSINHPLSGPSHEIDLSGPRLGLNIDGDSDGQQSPDATGDDLDSGTNDEDGVQIVNLIAGKMGSITIDVTVADGDVDAWIDFNADGNFSAAEKIVDDVSFTSDVQQTLMFPVPGDAAVGMTFARVRVSRTGNLGPSGFAGANQDGEVEDLQVTVQGLDFGDLGDVPGTSTAYRTLEADNGPRHFIAGPSLGIAPDAESDGIPSNGAQGDDTNQAPDDEDGVVLPIGGFEIGTTRQINVTVRQADGVVDGWIDFNQDGDFDDLGEKVIDSVLVQKDTPTPLDAAVPVTALVGNTGARFRVSSTGALGPNGLANDGEVEDYIVTIRGTDFGDAPLSKVSDGGPRHDITGPRLGTLVDAELDAPDPLDGSGDDDDNVDDEDGVTIQGFVFIGQAGLIDVAVNGVDAFLNAWIDFNGDNDFIDPGEQIETDRAVSAGSITSLGFPVPATATPGDRIARFRVSTSAGLGPTGVLPDGSLPDGEVEDHLVRIVEPDFGDAPDSYGTLSVSDGARHVSTGVRLGAARDSDFNAPSPLDGTGDDATGATPDDEDGVLLSQGGPFVDANGASVLVDTPVTFQIDVQDIGTSAVVQGWVDIDRNGTFDHPTEQLLSQTVVGPGPVTATFVTTFPLGSEGETFARFRVSSNGGLLPTGLAPDGEVEDYKITVQPIFDLGDAPDLGLGTDGPGAGGSFDYQTTLSDGGPVHQLVPGGPILGDVIDPDSDGQPDGSATGDDLDDPVNDEDGIQFPQSFTPGVSSTVEVRVSDGQGADATGFVTGWIDFDQNGVFDDSINSIERIGPFSVTGTMTSPLIAVPQGALLGPTFARFRVMASNVNPGPTGPDISQAPAGEVEDYLVQIVGQDFGDAPDTYGTSTIMDGARHIANGPSIGVAPDIDPGAQIQIVDDGTGDDISGIDDEDGVTLNGLQINGEAVVSVTTETTFEVTVNSTGSAVLQAWVDLDQSGTFDHPTEQIHSQGVGAGTTIVPVNLTIPLGSEGITYMRYRVSSAGGLTPTGLAFDGEVEDYRILALPQFDFGDAPDPAYATLDASGGPKHQIVAASAILGNNIDSEPDGQPDPQALGDDNDTSPNDEDGVTVVGRLAIGEPGVFNVTVSGIPASTTAYVTGWVDLNQDGVFSTAEQITRTAFTADGAQNVQIDIPNGALPGKTIARFRVFDQDIDIDPTGELGNGEVEDHEVEIFPVEYGDAPDTFGTLRSSDGARHILLGPTLGDNAPDPDPDGQTNGGSFDGTGDDVNGTDDEDSVTIGGVDLSGATLRANSSATIDVNVQNIAVGATADLQGWADFNGDGSFQANEEIVSQTINSPGNVIQVPVLFPVGSEGIRFIRFRVSTAGGLTPTGLAQDGEVEDYAVTVDPVFDFGDAPDSYMTTIAAGGPSHRLISNGPRIGPDIDDEIDGQPTNQADGDDVNGIDDEGASDISFNGLLTPGGQRSVDVNVGGAGGFLSAWIDFNQDGVFGDDTTEEILSSVAVNVGDNLNMPFLVDGGASLGSTFARFRIQQDSGNIGPGGQLDSGEVQDEIVSIVLDPNEFDFGDAPDTGPGIGPGNYHTVLGPNGVENGARHQIGGPRLGTFVDSEPDGQPTSAADGDDTDGTDDEDGVTSTLAFNAGVNSSIDVSVSNIPTTQGVSTVLRGWIDFNQDGDWNDAGENVITRTFLVAEDGTTQSIPVVIPLGAKSGTTFARFRVSTEQNLQPIGLAANGEVEDYQVQITGVDFGDAPDSYSTLLASGGARHFGTSTRLGLIRDTEADAQKFGGTLDGTGDDLGVDDEDGVTFSNLIVGENATATIKVSGGGGQIDAWIDFNADGDFLDFGEQIIDTAAGSHPVWLADEMRTVNFVVPSGATSGTTFARFRVSQAGGLSVGGMAPDGEVEDYRVQIVGVDFGDAPNSYGTLRASLGARHGATGSRIGPLRDVESAAPAAALDGTGDDITGSDDEDGVILSNIVAGQNGSATIQVVGSGGHLDAWIDFNADGDFTDAGEQVIDTLAGLNGPAWGANETRSVTIPIPSGATIGSTFARFRLSQAGNLTPTGLAQDGEVEDYAIAIQAGTTTTSLMTGPSQPNDVSAPASSSSLQIMLEDYTVLNYDAAVTSDSEIAAEALDLDQKKDLSYLGDYYENWGGEGEKWMPGSGGEWYFIKPNGAVYKWVPDSTDITNLSLSTQETVLLPAYHADPTMLHDAAEHEAARTLDAQKDLQFDGDYYTNWAGANEKWISGNDGWYFIKPDGSVYLWNDAAGLDLTQSVQVAQLNSDFYANPAKLHEASSGVTATTPEELAYQLDQNLDFQTEYPVYFNWGGQNEKWILGANNVWYFINPDGSLYQWDAGHGNDLTQSTKIAQLNSTFYSDPNLLINAQQPTASTSSAGVTASLSVDNNLGIMTVDQLPGTSGTLLIKVTAHSATESESYILTVRLV